ncbi:hypothetical protein CEK26_009996 [Fusarium fujikuroi]|uniref:Uncharacterized protein n=1 Tax=Fusarium fujikuroi TaxID=5127 RepID=A0A5Q3G0A9_FUSFU|nr:hypothetical protein CEK27_010016 [Fusarium fujikuroi]QGI83284.1 hypothetical protein CEK25_010013 [Fusarium fujikuroi]QGI96927.1 hypothetical protein CEK26_009996 [Fusarium fujikuroi]VTT55358.1 unnamed protein product [Fusarium fujikuroi]VTT57334.1 unnamed protein product [Fusarium fujikuroi]
MKLVGWPASKRRRRWKLEQGPEMVVQVGVIGSPLRCDHRPIQSSTLARDWCSCIQLPYISASRLSMSSEWVKYTSVLTWQTKPVYVHRNAAGQTNTGHQRLTTGISVAYLHMNGVCRIQIQLIITEGLMHM